ncbi:MAG: sulfotransferase family 2 domain-containing protein [Paracoccus sp. (in: a-proteobacteria)]|nr:sulfotransferase family 2 domain-containing protein [Paracoccus sp. (in: a-proteobacteria)]
MLIFWEKRLVFLATPKAGSTAIEVALESLASLAVQRPRELKHVDIGAYRSFVEPWLGHISQARFTTAALMREPIAWLQSWYRFRLRDEIDVPAPDGFERFVRAYLADPAGMTDGVGSQSRFLNADGHRVDRIFRYENMDNFTHFLDDWLDCEISLPRVNVPPVADVTLSEETTAELRDALQPDFRLYAELG